MRSLSLSLSYCRHLTLFSHFIHFIGKKKFLAATKMSQDRLTARNAGLLFVTQADSKGFYICTYIRLGLVSPTNCGDSLTSNAKNTVPQMENDNDQGVLFKRFKKREKLQSTIVYLIRPSLIKRNLYISKLYCKPLANSFCQCMYRSLHYTTHINNLQQWQLANIFTNSVCNPLQKTSST